MSTAQAQTGRLARAPEVTIIRPRSGWVPPRLGELWHYRELLYFLGRREIKVRYAQTLLGGFWTVLQPVAMMLVFTLAFRKLGNVETEGIAYPAFVLGGLVIWMFFSRSITYGANSLVANSELMTKSSAPRLVIPTAAVVIGFVDFVVVFALALVIAGLYGEYPSWEIVFAPLIFAFALLLAVGVAFLLSAVNVRFRDVRHSLPFMIQIWLFLSPIAYPLQKLGEPFVTLLAINPLVGIIETFRWCVFGTAFPPVHHVLLAAGVSTAIVFAGLAYFARVERTFADVA